MKINYMRLKTFNDELSNSGFKPTTHWLDNEISESIKIFDRNKSVAFQMVPPHMHRRNEAERAIRT